MIILGINGGVRLGYQDISATLVKDGEAVAAVEEERLNRVKFSPGQLPQLSISSVLKSQGLTMRDVDYIASHGETWGEEYENVLKGYFKYTFGHCPEIIRVHHHDAHSASAFYASGFDEAIILSIDNSGDGVSTQISTGKGAEMKLTERFSRPDSLGIFYSLITQFCGFTRDSDEYKLMGLSSYGNRNSMDFSWLLPFKDGNYHLQADYLKKVEPGQSQPTRQQMIFNERLIEKLGSHRMSHEPMTKKFEDIAASAQKHLEDVICDIVRKSHKSSGIRKLCLAGGVALNCVANQKLMNLDFIDEIYVQPASSDAGISLGAAYLAAARNGDKPKPMRNAYLGPIFSNAQIEEALKTTNVKFTRTDNPALVAAEKVSQDKIVGWFQGGMEFGPRGLGARSILANPANPAMKDIVNEKIKFRETFRPFCPSVLEEDSKLFFEGNQPIAPYMTVTYDVKDEAVKKIPSVTHVDKTARIQTVNPNQNPLFHHYLKELKNLTGLGVSMNTSFNVKGDPIVNTPYHAIATFYGSGMDCLVMGNYCLEK